MNIIVQVLQYVIYMLLSSLISSYEIDHICPILDQRYWHTICIYRAAAHSPWSIWYSVIKARFSHCCFYRIAIVQRLTMITDHCKCIHDESDNEILMSMISNYESYGQGTYAIWEWHCNDFLFNNYEWHYFRKKRVLFIEFYTNSSSSKEWNSFNKVFYCFTLKVTMKF